MPVKKGYNYHTFTSPSLFIYSSARARVPSGVRADRGFLPPPPKGSRRAVPSYGRVLQGEAGIWKNKGLKVLALEWPRASGRQAFTPVFAASRCLRGANIVPHRDAREYHVETKTSTTNPDPVTFPLLASTTTVELESEAPSALFVAPELDRGIACPGETTLGLAQSGEEVHLFVDRLTSGPNQSRAMSSHSMFRNAIDCGVWSAPRPKFHAQRQSTKPFGVRICNFLSLEPSAWSPFA